MRSRAGARPAGCGIICRLSGVTECGLTNGLAYYQGGQSLRTLKYSAAAADRELYHAFWLLRREPSDPDVPCGPDDMRGDPGRVRDVAPAVDLHRKGPEDVF